MKFGAAIFILTFVMSIEVIAQQDSLQQNDSTNSTQRVVTDHEMPQLKNTQRFTAETAVIIQAEEIPPELRKTLSDEVYRGWEKGVIMRHLQTGEFSVQLPAAQTFYFNKNGERKKQ